MLPLARAGLVAAVQTFLLVSVVTLNSALTSAQLPEPSLPFAPDSQPSQPPAITQTTPANIPPPTIEITLFQDGQQVPAGELTIGGISSDDEESDCQVYADVNDMTPMRKVTASSDSGGEGEDFSEWTFTYTQDYQLITEGENELTAKISCYAAGNPTPLSEWHTVNVTGVAAGQPVTSPAEGEPVPDISEDEEGDEEAPLFS
jgi:hypothetical protein